VVLLPEAEELIDKALIGRLYAANVHLDLGEAL
jgi:hypothetical protein